MTLELSGLKRLKAISLYTLLGNAGGDGALSGGGGGGNGAAAAAARTAEDVLIRCVRMYPYNWSAWLDLASLCLECDTVGAHYHFCERRL